MQVDKNRIPIPRVLVCGKLTQNVKNLKKKENSMFLFVGWYRQKIITITMSFQRN